MVISKDFSHSNPRDLLGLLRAKNIAVIGGHEAGKVIQQCDLLGYQGEIWPVNAKRESIEGRPCFKRIEDLPKPPDGAFIAIPAEPTIEAVRILSNMGAGGAVCYASGFKEVGAEGEDRQRRLVEAAGDMPIIGPNCYGVLNYLEGAALWPDQQGGERVDRGVAIITQSGNIAITMTMQQRSLPLAFMISLGNQASSRIEDCIEALLGEDRITAIGLHIEGINDIAGFERAALKALDCGIPIVALKTGSSSKGAKIALSHTASLAGEDGIYDTFLERVGVARVHTIPELLESLKFLSIAGTLDGNDIVSMSCSGGEASLIADMTEGLPLNFPPIEGQHKAEIQATLNEYVSVSNPLDYHTFIWARAEEMTDCFTAVLRGGYDVSILILDFPRDDRCDDAEWIVACDALISAAKTTGSRAAIVSTLQDCLPERVGKYLARGGVVPLQGLSEAMVAIMAAVQIGKAQKAARPARLLSSHLKEGKSRTYDEWRSKKVLSSIGVSAPEGALVNSATEAVSASESFGYPIVLKVVAETIVHKTEVGGVALNLIDADGVQEAAERLLRITGKILVERMITDSVAELIVGVDRDSQFGPYLLVGFGGIMVELIDDSRSMLLPTDRETVAATIRSLKTAALLEGYRGLPVADFDAIVDTILAVAKFVEDNENCIEEMDINPLMVRPVGRGVVAVDALIKMIDE